MNHVEGMRVLMESFRDDQSGLKDSKLDSRGNWESKGMRANSVTYLFKFSVGPALDSTEQVYQQDICQSILRKLSILKYGRLFRACRPYLMV